VVARGQYVLAVFGRQAPNRGQQGVVFGVIAPGQQVYKNQLSRGSLPGRDGLILLAP
jgi:hypothetical protein